MRTIEPPEVRRARGKALREKQPRSAHKAFTTPSDRPDVIELIKEEVKGRDLDLLAIRWQKMALSPFACFRGAAGVFAFDLGRAPTAGLDVQLCGDAHVFNLGAYAAPDGHLVFDLNDFDQACRGPFEWDLKRLAASFVLAGREAGLKAAGCRDAVSELVAAYREGLDEHADMRATDVARVEIARTEDHLSLAPIFARAQRDTPERLMRRMTVTGAGGLAQLKPDGPFLRPIDEAAAAPVLKCLQDYRVTLTAGRRQLLDMYTPHHVAVRAQGVGSLGLRGWIVLCYGNGPDDPLFLHVKEMVESVWTKYLPAAPREHYGRRAAEAQSRTQTVSDPFLGWGAVDGVECVARQWSDHKARCSTEMMAGKSLSQYAELCGHVLAKAHARTGDAAMLAGYCGGGSNLDEALSAFAVAYADQAEADHAKLLAAIAAGTMA